MTHINAFVTDVEDKKLAVSAAQSALATAQSALEAHPDYVAPKKEAVRATPKSIPVRDSKGHFVQTKTA